MTILENANVIVGNGDYLEGIDVKIEGTKLVEIGHVKANEGIDLSGKTILPGFIDAHVHLIFLGDLDPYETMSYSDNYLAICAAQNAKDTLEAGFTTVRDCGARNFMDVDLRNAIEAGTVPGPRLLVSGHIISITGGHGSFIPSREADGTEECRKAVREQLKAGVDWIKITATGGVLTQGSVPGVPQLTEEEISTIVNEAHRANRMIAAHAHGAEGIENAIEAGVDTIEHCTYADGKRINLMQQAGTIWVSTLKSSYDLNSKRAREAGIPQEILDKSEHAHRSQIESFQSARKKGINIILGTDSGTPLCHHGENAMEFYYLVLNGMTEMEAIITGTLRAAEALGIGDKVGSIEEGKIADLVVVNGNPLEDIRILTEKDNIEIVMKKGEIIVDRKGIMN